MNRPEHHAAPNASPADWQLAAQIIHHAREGIVVYDRDLRVLVWNPYMEELTGRPAATVRGRHRCEVFSTPGQRGPDELIARALAGEAITAPDIEVVLPEAGGRSAWLSIRYAPLRDLDGRLNGVIGTVRDVTERVRSAAELRETASRLQALSRRRIDAQEQERRRIARELHDQLGQCLTMLKITLQGVSAQLGPDAAPRLADGIAFADEALRQVRGLALDLRPALLDDLGLVPALSWFVRRQAECSGLPVSLAADPPDLHAPADVATACYRIAQEALTNVLRHAGAAAVAVELVRQKDELILTVHDDGRGFDVGAARRRAAGQSLGLLGMQERAALLGGTCTIDSAAGQGTTVRARFPLAAGDTGATA